MPIARVVAATKMMAPMTSNRISVRDRTVGNEAPAGGHGRGLLERAQPEWRRVRGG
jgi:hypothetical protein